MNYHIALSRPFDLEGTHREAQLGLRPRHTIWELSQQLGATVHQPENHSISLIDRLGAKIAGQPEHWALSRALVPNLNNDDVVFCTGEDIGLPLAILCKVMGKQPKLAVNVMAPTRPRVRGALKLFSLHYYIDLFLTNTQVKADAITRLLNIGNDRVSILPEQTDVNFFTPGSASPEKTRPIVASAGLEQRDYQTLAAATHDLDVDVRVCAVSPNASSKTQVAFPSVVPDNMKLRHYDWCELRQLYRDADVVAISLLDNPYSAGLTVLMEAMACRKPVVMTRTPGLAQRLINQGFVIGVEPGDVVGLREAIVSLLENPDLAETLARRNYALALNAHTSDLYVTNLIAKFKALTGSDTQEACTWASSLHSDEVSVL